MRRFTLAIALVCTLLITGVGFVLPTPVTVFADGSASNPNGAFCGGGLGDVIGDIFQHDPFPANMDWTGQTACWSYQGEITADGQHFVMPFGGIPGTDGGRLDQWISNGPNSQVTFYYAPVTSALDGGPQAQSLSGGTTSNTGAGHFPFGVPYICNEVDEGSYIPTSDQWCQTITQPGTIVLSLPIQGGGTYPLTHIQVRGSNVAILAVSLNDTATNATATPASTDTPTPTSNPDATPTPVLLPNINCGIVNNCMFGAVSDGQNFNYGAGYWNPPDYGSGGNAAVSSASGWGWQGYPNMVGPSVDNNGVLTSPVQGGSYQWLFYQDGYHIHSPGLTGNNGGTKDSTYHMEIDVKTTCGSFKFGPMFNNDANTAPSWSVNQSLNGTDGWQHMSQDVTSDLTEGIGIFQVQTGCTLQVKKPTIYNTTNGPAPTNTPIVPTGTPIPTSTPIPAATAIPAVPLKDCGAGTPSCNKPVQVQGTPFPPPAQTAVACQNQPPTSTVIAGTATSTPNPSCANQPDNANDSFCQSLNQQCKPGNLATAIAPGINSVKDKFQIPSYPSVNTSGSGCFIGWQSVDINPILGGDAKNSGNRTTFDGSSGTNPTPLPTLPPAIGTALPDLGNKPNVAPFDWGVNVCNIQGSQYMRQLAVFFLDSILFLSTIFLAFDAINYNGGGQPGSSGGSASNGGLGDAPAASSGAGVGPNMLGP